MKRLIVILSILILYIQGSSLIAKDINLRGQIVKYNDYYKTYEPLLNIKVSLYKNNLHIRTIYTNTKGFYYIYNIKPNIYTLHIKEKLLTINVKDNNLSNQQFYKIKKLILQ